MGNNAHSLTQMDTYPIYLPFYVFIFHLLGIVFTTEMFTCSVIWKGWLHNIKFQKNSTKVLHNMRAGQKIHRQVNLKGVFFVDTKFQRFNSNSVNLEKVIS